MRTIMFFICLILVANHASYGQTFNEWFKQKKTQKKYLLLQIAKLQVYLGYVKQGYEIVQGGLQLVSAIKQGDFNQHNDYFNHLKIVSPNVRKYSKAASILAIELDMLRTYQSAAVKLQGEPMLAAGHVVESKQILGAIADNALQDIACLQIVLTDGSLSMTDEERVEQIDQIYLSIKHKQELQTSFLTAVKATVHQRQQSTRDMDALLQLLNPE